VTFAILAILAIFAILARALEVFFPELKSQVFGLREKKITASLSSPLSSPLSSLSSPCVGACSLCECVFCFLFVFSFTQFDEIALHDISFISQGK